MVDHVVVMIMIVDATAWTYISMIGMETVREIVRLLTILATDGAMSLGGAPVTANRGVRGKVTNILLIIDLYFCQDLTMSSSLMSPAPGTGILLLFQAPVTIINHQTQTRIPFEVTYLSKTKNLHICTMYMFTYMLSF